MQYYLLRICTLILYRVCQKHAIIGRKHTCEIATSENLHDIFHNLTKKISKIIVTYRNLIPFGK